MIFIKQTCYFSITITVKQMEQIREQLYELQIALDNLEIAIDCAESPTTLTATTTYLFAALKGLEQFTNRSRVHILEQSKLSLTKAEQKIVQEQHDQDQLIEDLKPLLLLKLIAEQTGKNELKA